MLQVCEASLTRRPQVWLIEINSSPGVAERLHHQLARDLIRTAIDPLFPPEVPALTPKNAAKPDAFPPHNRKHHGRSPLSPKSRATKVSAAADAERCVRARVCGCVWVGGTLTMRPLGGQAPAQLTTRSAATLLDVPRGARPEVWSPWEAPGVAS